MARKRRDLFPGLQPALIVALALCTTLLILSPGLARQAADKPHTATVLVTQSPVADAQVLLQQGRERYQAGQFADAVTRWQQAVTVAAAQGDRLLQASALSNLALAEQQLGDWTSAKDAIARSLTVAGLSVSPAPRQLSKDQQQVFAQILTTQGTLQFASGEFDQALQYWQQAADHYRAIGDATNVTQSVINQVQALKALGLYKRAKSLLDPLYQTYSQQPPPLQLAILLHYGDTLRLLGRLTDGSPNAQTVLQQGLELAKQLQSAPAIATALINLGKNTRAQQDMQATRYADQPDELKKLYQDGLEYYRQTAAVADTALQDVRTALKRQSTLLKTPANSPQWAEAQALSASIQAQIDQLSPSHGTVYAQLQLAEHVLQLGGAQADSTAIQLFNTAATQAESLGDLPLQSYALWRAFYQQTLQSYQQAADVADAPTNKVQALLQQQSLLLDGDTVAPDQWAAAQALSALIQAQLDRLPLSHTALYAHIHFAQNLIKLGNEQASKRALQLLEMTAKQAEQLGDRQAQSYAIGSLGGIYEQKQQWQEAQSLTQQALLTATAIDAVDIAYRWQWQMGRLLKAQHDTQGAIAAYTQAVESLNLLRKDLATINTDNTDVQFSFRLSAEPVYLELVALLLQPDTANGNEQALNTARSVIESLQIAELENFFQEACASARSQIDGVDPAAAILYPIVLNDRLEVILSLYDANAPQQARLSHYSTPITSQQVEQTANRFRQALIPSAPHSDHFLLGQTLYDWLIRPAEAELAQAKVKTLVFIMNGSLRNIPMSALYDGTQFLMQKYSVALTPSLQLIHPQPLAHKQINALVAGLTEANQGFPALPSVATEVKEIQATVPSTLMLNENLTNQKLEQQLNNVPFNVIHLATHGQFSSNADQTFILTWNQRLNVRQFDALLRTKDKKVATPLELLVLSACQTASGDKRAALGLAGVAVRSGARSTVASLWPVNDEATAVFMTAFYQALNRPDISKAQALSVAQLSLLSKYPSPYYWAPFVLVGNWL